MLLQLDILQLRSNKGYIYQDRSNDSYSSRSQAERAVNMRIQREKAYQGKLSIGSRKRLSKALHVLSEMTPKRKVYNEVSKRVMYFHLSMITLTVPANDRLLTPKEGNKLLLREFLRWMVRTKGCKGYVWKCEHTKKGQIHYHIIQNVYVNYSEIRNKWNYLLNKQGLLDQYYRDYGHRNANSTDVHAIKRVKNITSYFMSYLKAAKNDKDVTEGKIWDCSQNVKNGKYFTVNPDDETNRNIKEGIRNGSILKDDLDFCTCLTFIRKPAKYYLSKKQFQECKAHYRDYLYQDILPPKRKKRQKVPECVITGQLN